MFLAFLDGSEPKHTFNAPYFLKRQSYLSIMKKLRLAKPIWIKETGKRATLSLQFKLLLQMLHICLQVVWTWVLYLGCTVLLLLLGNCRTLVGGKGGGVFGFVLPLGRIALVRGLSLPRQVADGLAPVRRSARICCGARGPR